MLVADVGARRSSYRGGMSESHDNASARDTVDKGKWIGACIAICSGIGVALGAIFDLERITLWAIVGVGSGAIVGALITLILARRRGNPETADDDGAAGSKRGTPD